MKKTETVQEPNSDFLELKGNVRAAYILNQVHCGDLGDFNRRQKFKKVLRRAVEIDEANLGKIT